MNSFKMVRLVVDDVAAAFPRLTINCQMHEAKSQTGSWQNIEWVNFGFVAAAGVSNICSKCVSAGRVCVHRRCRLCITANSGSMESLCPGSSPPHHGWWARFTQCQIAKLLKNIFRPISEPLSNKSEDNNKKREISILTIGTNSDFSTEFQISSTVAKSVHIWWWIDQIDHIVTFQKEPLFNWTIRSYT